MYDNFRHRSSETTKQVPHCSAVRRLPARRFCMIFYFTANILHFHVFAFDFPSKFQRRVRPFCAALVLEHGPLHVSHLQYFELNVVSPAVLLIVTWPHLTDLNKCINLFPPPDDRFSRQTRRGTPLGRSDNNPCGFLKSSGSVQVFRFRSESKKHINPCMKRMISGSFRRT